jgi:hypothetical protein
VGTLDPLRAWVRGGPRREMNGSGTSRNLAFPFLVAAGFYSRLTSTRTYWHARLGPEGAHICIHKYTRIYIHTFYQTDIRKWDFSSLSSLSFCERKRDRKSFANGKLEIFRRFLSDWTPGLPPPLTASSLHIHTYTRRLTVEFVFSAPFGAASAGARTRTRSLN